MAEIMGEKKAQSIVLLLLFTAIGFSPGGSSPYTSTHNTNVFTRWQ
jgi:hypothetical protein